MKKVAIVSLTPNKIKKDVVEAGFKIVKNNPDFVISFGGDGTNLVAEAKYPGIPRVLIRNSKICYKCHNGHDLKEILDFINKGNYKIVTESKLEADFKNRKLIALNEINIHYRLPTALRFKLMINDSVLYQECIGDGIVIATPHGSTGYFNSITGDNFNRGIGLAFNNIYSTIKVESKGKIVNEDSIIIVEITRGPGYLAYDSSKKVLNLKTGDKITIKKSNQVSRIFNSFGKKSP